MLKFIGLALRIRYILPATAVGGYYSLKNKYDEFRSNIPELPNFDSWTATLNESAQTLNSWFDEAGEALKNKTQLDSSTENRKYSIPYLHICNLSL